MKPTRTLIWDIDKVAAALQVNAQSVREYFTDGRRVAFLIERRIAQEEEGFKLAHHEGADHDLVDSTGAKWEVRNITRGGVYFCPSGMVGSGRSFAQAGFLRKLANVSGYILSDIESFPAVPYWILERNIIERWWESGRLGINAKISRTNILELIKMLP